MSYLAPFTGWDWFVIATLIVSTALGLFSGLVRTVFALAGWIIALVGAPLAAPGVIGATGWTWHPLLVIAILFFALLIFVRLLGALLSAMLSKAGLGGIDRLLGGVLGVARALLIVAVAAVVASALGAQHDPAWQRALSRPLLEQLVMLADPWLPERGGVSVSGLRRT
jgi:membrane protein required for colicin V production